MTYTPVEGRHAPDCERGLGLSRELDPENCERCAKLATRLSAITVEEVTDSAKFRAPEQEEWQEQEWIDPFELACTILLAALIVLGFVL